MKTVIVWPTTTKPIICEVVKEFTKEGISLLIVKHPKYGNICVSKTWTINHSTNSPAHP